MHYSFDSSVETLWVFSHGLICNSHSGYFHRSILGRREGKGCESKTELKFHLIAWMIFFFIWKAPFKWRSTCYLLFLSDWNVVLKHVHALRCFLCLFIEGNIQKCRHVISVFVNVCVPRWFDLPKSKVDLSTKSLWVPDMPLMGNLFCPPLSERCTSSSRATNKRCVASGRRRDASRPSRRTTRPPAVSAARPSLRMAAATSAHIARPNSALAAEAGSLCAPTMWENWPSTRFLFSFHSHLIPAVVDAQFSPSASVCLLMFLWLPGHTLVETKVYLKSVFGTSRSPSETRVKSEAVLCEALELTWTWKSITASVLSCVSCNCTAAIKQAWQALLGAPLERHD